MNSPILIRDGRLLNPATKEDRQVDLLIENGRISSIAPAKSYKADGIQTIEASGLIIAPGFVDLHVHLRDPGQWQKETIETGKRAAAAGGFTTICAMPNTDPVNDSAETTSYIVSKARELAGPKVYPIGAITHGSKGKELVEFSALAKAGCIAFSDDGKGVQCANIMRRALEYSLTVDSPLTVHEEVSSLTVNGVINEGAVSARRGLVGIPALAEEIMIARDIELVRLTGGALHICHLTTKRGVELVRQAKEEGLPVTCEVSPHHLMFTEEAVINFNTNCKVNPPLRTDIDRQALRQGLAQGIIDCIATDHAPHEIETKEVPFPEAAFGTIGLQTALPVLLELVQAGELSLLRAIEALSFAPARCFKLEAGIIAEKKAADLAIINLEQNFILNSKTNCSRSANSAFWERNFKGAVTQTIVDGVIVYQAATAGGK